MMSYTQWGRAKKMRKKCSICGREIELTRNDAEEVFVFKEGKTICGKCYLKERYRNEPEQAGKCDHTN